ncbi:MAG: hypothetical protein IKQ39_01870 [Oscillospiraceae bacterium]|nr:hypothetical protein [Oscillospiraceae bacterium]
MKKKLYAAACAAMLAIPAMSFPASADTPELPFTLEAPRNVSMVWLDGNDSANTIEIHYSQNNPMSNWSTRKANPDEYDTVVAELNDMGYDDLWITAQIDWSIDTADDWHVNQYWETGGYDADYKQHLGDWAYTECSYSPEIANSEWIFRGMGNIDDPEDWAWHGSHTDSEDIPGWKDVLKEGQYKVVKGDDESYAVIDLTEHTIYARVRWLVTCRPLEGDDLYVTSEWSEPAAIGKDAVQTEALKPGDVAAPVISDLVYTDEEFNDYPVIAFRLAVDDTLEKQLAQVSGTQGTLWMEVEARKQGSDEWVGLQGDWMIKAGDMEIGLQNLAEAEGSIEKDTPIELRARYWISQADQEDFYTDYSEVLVFGAEAMVVATQAPAAEESVPETSVTPYQEAPPTSGAWWIILLILLILLILAIIIVIILKKKKKDKKS